MGVDYAISKEIRSTTIGPNIDGGAVKQTLDVLGFIVGKPVSSGLYKNMYPITTPEAVSTVLTSGTTHDTNYTGFHSLGGLYDEKCKELQSMRKSANPVLDLDTGYVKSGNQMAGVTATTAAGVTEHAHKDWPDNVLDQTHLLNENPWSDSLYYHSTRLSFLLTGITLPTLSDKASNHRGL